MIKDVSKTGISGLRVLVGLKPGCKVQDPLDRARKGFVPLDDCSHTVCPLSQLNSLSQTYCSRFGVEEYHKDGPDCLKPLVRGLLIPTLVR